MFKKLYKEANDEIVPNRAVLDKIYAEYEKSKTKKVYFNVKSFYRYSAYAAAVLVLAVGAYSYPKIAEFAEGGNKQIVADGGSASGGDAAQNVKAVENGEDISGITSNAEATADKAVEKEKTAMAAQKAADVENKTAAAAKKESAPVENAQTSTYVSFDKGENKASSAAEIQSKEKAAETDNAALQLANELKDESAPKEEDANNENAKAESTEAESTGIMRSMLTSSGGGSSVGSGGGGGGGAARSAIEYTTWDMQQYIDYIGLDLKGIKYPDDLTDNSVNEVYVGMLDGEMRDDTATLSYVGENRTVVITVSKNNSFITEAMEATNRGGYTVYTDGTAENLYFTAKDINFAVFSEGLSENETDEIIASIFNL